MEDRLRKVMKRRTERDKEDATFTEDSLLKMSNRIDNYFFWTFDNDVSGNLANAEEALADVKDMIKTLLRSTCHRKKNLDRQLSIA